MQNTESIFIESVQRKNPQVTYRGKPVRIIPDFSLENLKARRAWSKAFQVLQDRYSQPRLINLTKLSALSKGEREISMVLSA